MKLNIHAYIPINKQYAKLLFSIKYKILAFVFLFSLFFNQLFAQYVGINATGNTPAISSGLDIDFTDKGLLIPRVALTGTYDITSIATPANSLLVYNIAMAGVMPNNVIPGYYYYNGTKWISLSGGSGGNDWSLTGNAGTNATLNFIGTIDDNDIVFKRNNVQSGLINNAQFNTSLGVGALNPLLAGGYNTAIGKNAMFSAGGSENTAVGVYSMYDNATGLDNTAVGAFSGKNNTDGKYNTAIGTYSLWKNTMGNNNTALGFNAGFQATGSNNTFIGYQAGDNITSGNNNIILGYDIDATSATNNNQLNIGNIIYGTGIDGSGTTLSNGNIGIGKNNPQYKFDVFKNTSTPHDRAVNIFFNSSAFTTSAPMHGDSSAALYIRSFGTSTGDVYSGYFNTTSNSTGYSAGLLNFVNGSGTGTKLGIGEMISGNGDKAGYTANISGGGNLHYGMNVDVSGAATNYGINATVSGSGTSGYGIYITGSPKYSAFLDQGIFYSKNNGYFGYTSGTYDLAYMLDVNGRANFTNALFFNGTAGTSGYLLKSNGSGSAPTWTDPALLGFYWDMDLNGNIFNSNYSSGYVDVLNKYTKDFTFALNYNFRIRSNESSNFLALQFGINTDAIPANRYGAIEVDDAGIKRNLILQPGSGNVGIGTTSPVATLHVVGNSRITSLSGIGNRIVRTDANGTLTAYTAGTASQVLLGTGVWGSVPGAGNDWAITGNAGTTPGTNFIGTTDAQDFVMKTGVGGIERMRILSTGNVGIGTAFPTKKLDVFSNSAIDGISVSTSIWGVQQRLQFANNEIGYCGLIATDSANAGYPRELQIINNRSQGSIYFKTGGGLYRMRITTDGRVGIGTGSAYPNAVLQVDNNTLGGVTEMIVSSSNTTDADFVLQTNNTNMGWFGGGTINKLAAWNYANNTEPFTILGANGYVGIGVTSPSEKLTVSGAETTAHGKNAAIGIINTSAPGTGWFLRAGAVGTFTPNGGFSIADNSGYRLCIDNVGNVGIGTTTPTQRLTVFNGTTTGTYTTTGWIHSSDSRLKTNVKPIVNALNKVQLLNGIYFNWINMPDSLTQIGFLAQDVEKVVPEVVVKDADGKYGMAYGNLSALFVEAFKEQQKQIEDLKAIVAEQQKQINQLLKH